MYCLVMVDSGNYAFKLYNVLKSKGYHDVEVIPTPCKLAKSGCGYCIKAPLEYKDVIIKEGQGNNIRIREIYTVKTEGNTSVYEKIM
ncbi:MAG: DUF3343 domain-containing protein [Clostridiaceae bacterium]|nr:DUF3343 domain-containing protein [Clostridiaceae bacterium]